MDESSCGNCNFWEKSKVVSSATGECHRYAPKPGYESKLACWPLTDDDYWCGEFKAKLGRSATSQEFLV